MKQMYSPMAERTLFLAGITFLGGFLDSYTYMTRGGVFANNHTGNVAKLGIYLAQGNLDGAWNCLVPVIACVFGAVASEWVKNHTGKEHSWRIRALLAETLVLLAIGYVPASVPDSWVNTTLSFVTGFQLCLFRVSRWGAHNTTICTGNLRSVGQFLYGACRERSRESWIRAIGYTLLVSAFVLGAAVGAQACLRAGSRAVLAGGLLSAVLTGALAGERIHVTITCYPAVVEEGQ